MGDVTGVQQSSGAIWRIPLALLRTMRPKQWTKNGAVFAGLVFDAQLFVVASLARVLLAFFLFCMIAGTVYIINDLIDIEKDRQHPRKRNRPLPSGQLPVRVAIVAAVVLPLASLAVAVAVSPALALTLLVYLLLQLAYSFWLKNIVIIDVLTIAAGFLLRVIAGVVVIEVARFSPWLYVVTGFLALFLAVGKRRQELITLAEQAGDVRPVFHRYSLPLLDDMLRLVTTGTLLAYTLYTFEANPDRHAMLLTIPLVLYGVMRYLYLMHVEEKGSAPDEVLLEDMPLLGAVILWGILAVVILYIG
jgi:4-hydroxybenzoate polyprenyltransferase